MSASTDTGEHAKYVTTSKQYQEKLKTYQACFKRDQSTCYTLLSCMHDDLLGELDGCHSAKDMWDNLRSSSVRHPLQGYVPCT